MGAGKTTVGKLLAKNLGWDFMDLDAEIETLENQTINEIVQNCGWDYFRELEAKVFSSIMSKHNQVISLGGGFPCNLGNWDNISKLHSVYLEVNVLDLVSRLSVAYHQRPLLANLDINSHASFIEQELNKRLDFYKKADITINGSLSPEEVSRKIIDLIKIPSVT